MYFDNIAHTCRQDEQLRPQKSYVTSLTVEAQKQPLSSTPLDTTKPVAISITVSPPTPPTGQPERKVVPFQPDFDKLFENPSASRLFKYGYTGDSLDEGVYSFDNDTGPGRPYDSESCTPVSTPGLSRHLSATSVGCLSRVDSVMEQSFTEMLAKNYENSGGLVGFRRRMATEISHKYCSYCRCDNMIFVFLYVVFGMAYISAGALGVTQCPDELFVNLFLVCDGVLSVFVFPITVMEWSQRIGGCINDQEKLGHGAYYVIILVFRLAAAVIGSFLIATNVSEFPDDDDAICWTVFMLLKAGVALEWSFILFALLLPFLVYGCMYILAHRSNRPRKVSFE